MRGKFYNMNIWGCQELKGEPIFQEWRTGKSWKKWK